MRISPEHFRQILDELVDENPLACRGMLGVCEVEFTPDVPTLAVTLADPATLKVNLAFVEANCLCEDHVRSLVLHEFLHVVLQHTFRYRKMTPLLNVALDAVINSTIHRLLGPRGSGFMSLFYTGEKGLGRLLRPPTKEEEKRLWRSTAREATEDARITECAVGLYERGSYQTDEVIGLCEDLRREGSARDDADTVYIGNHGQDGTVRDLSPEMRDLLEGTLESLRHAKGFCREPRALGTGYSAAASRQRLAAKWRQTTELALRAILKPRGGRGLREPAGTDAPLPILTPRDRRACVRQEWSPFLVEALWRAEAPRGSGDTQVYLDVSGSMNAEIRELVSLLARFRRAIREPLWAFSTEVFPARLLAGRLEARSTGGTDIDSVLRHLSATRPHSALLVTDGCVGTPNASLLGGCSTIRLHAIISPAGNPTSLRAAGVPCFSLPPLHTR